MRKAFVIAAVASVGFAATARAELPSDLFSTQTKTATSSAPVSDTVLWTPASGKRIILQGVIVCAQAAADNVQLESSDVDVIPPFGVESYGCKTFTAGGSAIWMGTTDATLTYSVGSGASVSFLAWGYEIQ